MYLQQDTGRPQKSQHGHGVQSRIAVMLATCLAFLVAGPALAAHPKHIDLSNKTDPAGEYEIGFCSRPSPGSSGWPGHAFVSFSHKTANGRDFAAVGHTLAASTSPAAATWSLFSSPVSGRLKEETYTSVLQDCLIVRVNKDDYERAYAMTQPSLAKMGLARDRDIVFQAYKLGSEDCLGLAIEVAETLAPRGLKVPDRAPAEHPTSYIERLAAAN